MMSQARQMLAHRLGCEASAGWLLLIWHCFVLPSDQRRALPLLDGVAAHLLDVLANELGVNQRSDPQDWLRCLLWRPSEMPPSSSPSWVRTNVVLPLQGYLAANVDLPEFGRRLDAMSLSIPGLVMGWRVVLFGVCLPILLVCMSTPLPWQDQALFALATCLIALFTSYVPGNTARVFLISLSVIATSRYLWWRLTASMSMDAPWPDILCSGLLLLAELYAVAILLLGYFQTAWPLNRQPATLPPDVAEWPSVDIYIPTYNEPLKVLRPTVLAAMGLDWPADKLTIYILDDGRRDEIRQFACDAGVEYMIRPDNAHAKAGNLNHALRYTHGDYIAIFDCDHIPTRTFLQKTMGWFLRDEKCAMVQTPHHFFSADPFTKNLGISGKTPDEDRLFHGLIQNGNDFWNATFFCGSCAVIKRGPLLEVGGVAVETVTEDAHTALKLHRLGYHTAFINLPQAAGLATESLASHVGQRIRWARGMVQIFRIDNPFFGKGLSLAQRICYGNAMLHFLYGVPRLIFLCAPLCYTIFGMHLIVTDAVTILAYIFPQLFHANIANSRAQGGFRHSFWSEAYETVLAWYIAVPTTLALINPKLGKFNVTSKGDIVERDFYDWDIAKPYLVLMALNMTGLAFGLVRLFVWNAHEPAVVMLNIFWVLYNLLSLGVAMGAARETRQIRMTHRVPLHAPAILYRLDGRALRCTVNDYSMGGLGLTMAPGSPIVKGEHVRLVLSREADQFAFDALVVWAGQGNVGLRLEHMTLDDEKNLVACTFARPDAWLGKQVARDKPFNSIGNIWLVSMASYKELMLLAPRYMVSFLQQLRTERRHRKAGLL